MKDALVVSALSVLPRNWIAARMGWWANTWVSRWFLKGFVWLYNVDLSEASRPLESYASLEDLFTRTLKTGARDFSSRPGTLVSPVDGRVAFLGTTVNHQITMGEHQHFPLGELLGKDVSGEWDVAILYLAPPDYHRVHSPHDARITGWTYVPGTLWPVFPGALRRVKNLFCRNERICIHMETPHGPMHTILVGAFGVGRIGLDFTDLLSNLGHPSGHTSITHPIPIGGGDSLGAFHLGSTVILCTPKGQWAYELSANQRVLAGNPIARRSQAEST